MRTEYTAPANTRKWQHRKSKLGTVKGKNTPEEDVMLDNDPMEEEFTDDQPFEGVI